MVAHGVRRTSAPRRRDLWCHSRRLRRKAVQARKIEIIKIHSSSQFFDWEGWAFFIQIAVIVVFDCFWYYLSVRNH